MAIFGKNKHYRFAEVKRRHFNETAARCFLRADARPVIEHILARTPGAIDAVAKRLPAGFPESVASAIFEGLAKSAEQLEAMPEK
jgi:serine/threonine-protein kinase HipA